MAVLGVDGWRGAWVGALLDGRSVTVLALPDVAAVLAVPDVDLVAIDMPIGLSDDGVRACDVAARRLLGATLSSGPVSLRIVEVEAYGSDPAGPWPDPAAHSWPGPTARNAVMFGPAGRLYVYRSYGIHALLNAVSEAEGVGAAVLIRALEPVDGIELMQERRGLEALRDLCSGPGKLTQALDIELGLNGADLRAGPILITPRPRAWRTVQITADRRIGITRAVELPWRFCATGSRYLSRGLSAYAA